MHVWAEPKLWSDMDKESPYIGNQNQPAMTCNILPLPTIAL